MTKLYLLAFKENNSIYRIRDHSHLEKVLNFNPQGKACKDMS